MDERLRNLIRAVEASPDDRSALEAALAECNRLQSLEGATKLSRVTSFFFVVEVEEGFVLGNMKHCRTSSGEQINGARVTVLLSRGMLNNNKALMPAAWASFRDSAWELPSLQLFYSIMRELSELPMRVSAAQREVIIKARDALRTALSWGLITHSQVRYPGGQESSPVDIITHHENGREFQDAASLSENVGVIHLDAAAYWTDRARALFGDTAARAVDVFQQYNFETVEFWVIPTRQDQEFPVTIRGVTSGPRLTLMANGLQHARGGVYALGVRWL